MRLEALALLGMTLSSCHAQGIRAFRRNTQPNQPPYPSSSVGWNATSPRSVVPALSSSSSSAPSSSSQSHDHAPSPVGPGTGPGHASSSISHHYAPSPVGPGTAPGYTSSYGLSSSTSSYGSAYSLTGTAPRYSSSHSLTGTASSYASSYSLTGTAPRYPSSHSLTGTAPGYGSSYSLTGTAPRHSSSYSLTGTGSSLYRPTGYSSSNSSNAVCSGETLNVLGASLDWWYTRTLYNVVSTISVQFNSDHSQTGWTVLPATTSFDLQSAMASETCASTLTFNTQYNASLWDVNCTPAPTPVAASTTVITQTAYKQMNATTGVGPIPNVVSTPLPATITIPSSGGTYAEGTAFVYFSKYEIMSKSQTKHANGSVGCAEATQVYNMEAPFSFEYTDGDVNGTKVVGAGVTGDVAPAFLKVVGQSKAVAGSWVAAPTVAVVVQDIYAAEAVLAAAAGTLKTTETILQTPQPTLPSGFTPPPGETTGNGLQSIGFTGHVESTAPSLAVPTQPPHTIQPGGGHHTNGQSHSPPHTSGGGGTPTHSNGGRPTNGNSGKPTHANGGKHTNGSGGKPTNGHTGAIGHLVSVILSAAKPTNALQVLQHADQTFKTNSPTVAAITHSTNGGGAHNGGSHKGGSHNGGSHNGGSHNGGSNGVGSHNGGSPKGETHNGASHTGGTNNGGTNNGGTNNGGTNNGGTNHGGTNNGGTNNGGSNNGGSHNGGSSSGATHHGGSNNGGSNNGGSNNGGSNNGGSNNGGSNNGGAHGGGASTAAGKHGGSGSSGGAANQNNGVGTGAHGTPVVVVGGTTFTADSKTHFKLGPTATLTPGGTAVLSGTTVSLASGLTAVVINGHTHTAFTPSITTAPPILTIAGTTFAPSHGPTYNIGGQTLTPGGVITVHGTTVSLGQGASSVVVNGLTQKIGPATATALAASITAPPVLTVGGKTFTAINSGDTYVINGETVTPGESETVTIGGKTYIISLAPHATMIVIKTVGANGQVTATTMETLYPAAGSQSTVTNTKMVGAETGSKSSSGPSASVQASLQNSASSLSLQLSGACLSLGTLALAIWL